MIDADQVFTVVYGNLYGEWVIYIIYRNCDILSMHRRTFFFLKYFRMSDFY